MHFHHEDLPTRVGVIISRPVDGENQLLLKTDELEIWNIPEDVIKVNEAPENTLQRILKELVISEEYGQTKFEMVGDMKAWPVNTQNTALYRLYVVNTCSPIATFNNPRLGWFGNRKLKTTGVKIASIVPPLTTKCL